MNDTKTIQVKRKTHEALRSMKMVERETFDSVIQRLMQKRGIVEIVERDTGDTPVN